MSDREKRKGGKRKQEKDPELFSDDSSPTNSLGSAIAIILSTFFKLQLVIDCKKIKRKKRTNKGTNRSNFFFQLEIHESELNFVQSYSFTPSLYSITDQSF